MAVTKPAPANARATMPQVPEPAARTGQVPANRATIGAAASMASGPCTTR
jgi:hypothetical protein